VNRCQAIDHRRVDMIESRSAPTLEQQPMSRSSKYSARRDDARGCSDAASVRSAVTHELEIASRTGVSLVPSAAASSRCQPLMRLGSSHEPFAQLR